MKHHADEHEATGRSCSLAGALCLCITLITGVATFSAFTHGISKAFAFFALASILFITLAVAFYASAFRNLDKADRLRRLHTERKH